METNKKSVLSKNNILAFLIFFTFAFPIIPIGGLMAYSHFFPTKATSNSSESSFEVEEPSYPYSSSNTQNNDPSTYSESRGTSDCTSDCSGHDAGYEWGEKQEICDTDYDNGNSDSFNEGVRAWAEDHCNMETDDSYNTGSYYDY